MINWKLLRIKNNKVKKIKKKDKHLKNKSLIFKQLKNTNGIY